MTLKNLMISKFKLINIFFRLRNFINGTNYIIPKNEKAKNFSYKKNFENEFNVLTQCIDENKDHYDCLNNKGEKKGYDRYLDIKSYTHNSIKISTKDKYINASPINIIEKNYFISTQGPIKRTIEHFWTMINDYKSNVIIMLCKLEEDGRSKCAKYWDNKLSMERFIVEVQTKETIKKDNYIIRKIKLTEKPSEVSKGQNEPRIITQIHFTGWPDNGIPDTKDGKVFETFEEIICEVDKLKGKAPIVVHCSAGVGRTGTFISMYYLSKEIDDQIKNKKLKEIKFNVFNLVRKLKEMRIFLVQNELQYLFVYQFIEHYLKKYNIEK